MGETVNSVAKAFKLLDYICGHGRVNLQDAAALLSSNKSSAFRMLETMCAAGYLYKRKGEAVYEPGLKVEILSQRRLSPLINRARLRPILKSVADKINADVMLCMFTDQGMVFVEKEMSNSILRIDRPQDICEPLYCTASGKAILAFLPEEHREYLLQRMKLVRLTDRTICDVDALRAQLNIQAKLGYAYEEEEIYQGVSCIAVPVYDRYNWPFYSLGISLSTRTLEHADSLAMLLKQGAKEIKTLLR